MSRPIADSPTEQLRKQLPRGNWSGPVAELVYRRLANIADQMSRSNNYLSDWHVETMAVMGTGHEETMKGHLGLLTSSGWQWDASITSQEPTA